MTKGFEYFDATIHGTLCAQCGYRFVRGDEALKIHETGDIVHYECLMDYTEDNVDTLCDKIDF